MIPLETLLAFFLASVLLALAPGPDNIFVLTQSSLYGKWSGLAVVLGLCTGLVVHSFAVALGVAVIFHQSAVAFSALKMAGAGYLLYLAWQAFRASATKIQGKGRGEIRLVKLYGRGIIMNITNPKVSIFFLLDHFGFMNCRKDNCQRFCRLFIPQGLLIFFLCWVLSVEPVQKVHAGEDIQSVACSSPCSEPLFHLTPKQFSISLWAREVVAEKVGGKVPRQDTRNLDALYGEAAVADKYLKRMTRTIAESTGGTPVFPPGGGLKGRKRAREKIEVELGGDASALRDISRSSIEYDDVDQVYQALEFILHQGYEVVRVKDRALEPLASGFWDIHLNLCMPNGHIAELQLHLKEIRQYSILKGHDLYVQIRGMEAGAVRENRQLTLEEQATIDRLNCEQRRVYRAAFQRGQKGKDR